MIALGREGPEPTKQAGMEGKPNMTFADDKSQFLGKDAMLSRYGERALDEAIQRITELSTSMERAIAVDMEVYSIGRLAAADQVPSRLALEAMLWAAQHMPSDEPRGSWDTFILFKGVERAFKAGMESYTDACDPQALRMRADELERNAAMWAARREGAK